MLLCVLPSNHMIRHIKLFDQSFTDAVPNELNACYGGRQARLPCIIGASRGRQPRGEQANRGSTNSLLCWKRDNSLKEKIPKGGAQHCSPLTLCTQLSALTSSQLCSLLLSCAFLPLSCTHMYSPVFHCSPRLTCL